MARFAVMAVGVDRPGNVSAVAGVLVEQDCNLEDTEIAVLRGYSTMMLVVAGPDGLTAEVLRSALEAGTFDIGLDITVGHMDAETADPRAAWGQPWSVSMYGSDRPGIVFEVTRVLARADVNISGMKTRVRGPAELPVYTMSLDVQVPATVNGEEVAAQLADLASRLNVACSMRPAPQGAPAL